MLPAEPLVVHEGESEFESGRQEITGPVRWVTLLSADRTPSSDIVLGLAEIEPGESGEFRQHSHKHAEAYYILSGSGVVTISNKDYSIRAGTTVFFPRGAVHRTVNTGLKPLRFLYVFPADSFDQIDYKFAGL
jgi:mannose-6-phosphate isomerase-like protein (cupin superfamily)